MNSINLTTNYRIVLFQQWPNNFNYFQVPTTPISLLIYSLFMTGFLPRMWCAWHCCPCVRGRWRRTMRSITRWTRRRRMMEVREGEWEFGAGYLDCFFSFVFRLWSVWYFLHWNFKVQLQVLIWIKCFNHKIF